MKKRRPTTNKGQESKSGRIGLLQRIRNKNNLKWMRQWQDIIGAEETDADERREACHTLGKLLRETMDADACACLIRQTLIEPDKYAVASILRNLALLDVLPDVDIGPILKHAYSDKWIIRHSAINALGSVPTPESKRVLADWLHQTDERKYQYEIICANAALGRIGDRSDIPLLMLHRKSRIRDIRSSAQFAIDRIQERGR